MIQFSTLCQPGGICLEAWGGHSQHPPWPTRPPQLQLCCRCVRTICHCPADEGSPSGASAPAQNHPQRGSSSSPKSPSPHPERGQKGKAGSSLLHPCCCTPRLLSRTFRIPHLAKNTGKSPVVLQGSRSTALQNAAEEHKRQKIKHPPRQHAGSIPAWLHPALPQGERAATAAQFPRFYPMGTAQGSRISRGFWEGNDKAAAPPVHI